MICLGNPCCQPDGCTAPVPSPVLCVLHGTCSCVRACGHVMWPARLRCAALLAPQACSSPATCSPRKTSTWSPRSVLARLRPRRAWCCQPASVRGAAWQARRWPPHKERGTCMHASRLLTCSQCSTAGQLQSACLHTGAARPPRWPLHASPSTGSSRLVILPSLPWRPLEMQSGR